MLLMKTVALATFFFTQLLNGQCRIHSHSNASRIKGVSERIYGGSLGNPKKAPYIAYLKIVSSWDPGASNDIRCTGSVISLSWVLTASHCMDVPFLYNKHNAEHDDRYANLEVAVTITVAMVDTNAESERNHHHFFANTDDLFTPPNCKEYSGPDDTDGQLRKDVALVRVKGGFPHGHGIKVIPLMTGHFPSDRVEECVAMGFGMVATGVKPWTLKQHVVEVGDWRYCEMLYPTRPWMEYHICAVGKVGRSRACAGDSGGPLLCGSPENHVVVATLSGTFGDHNLCGASEDDVHYISTGAVENWIRQTTGASDLRFVPFQ